MSSTDRKHLLHAEIVSDYLINEKTIAFKLCRRGCGMTKVFEQDRIIFVEKSALDVLKHACIYLSWCTYEGIRAAMRRLLFLKYKVPIPVNLSQQLLFFPTHGDRNENNIWIRPEMIARCWHGEFTAECMVQFSNRTTVKVLLEKDTLHDLYLLAMRCKNEMSGDSPFSTI